VGARCWGGHVYEVTPTELTLPARVHPPRVAGPLARPRPPLAMSSLLTETPGWKMCLRIALAFFLGDSLGILARYGLVVSVALGGERAE
jgi:hypothetical protein